MSAGATDLVRSMLAVDPKSRVTASAVLTGQWLRARGGRAAGAPVSMGTMRERATSGWAEKGKEGESKVDRGQQKGAPRPGGINTDAKMVFGSEGAEGKLGFSLQQPSVVSQFSRWIVDRMFQKKEMRILARAAAPPADRHARPRSHAIPQTRPLPRPLPHPSLPHPTPSAPLPLSPPSPPPCPFLSLHRAPTDARARASIRPFMGRHV